MSVVRMSKFELTIFDRAKEDVLRALQDFCIVHINDLSQRKDWLEQGAKRQDTGLLHEDVRQRLTRIRNAVDGLSAYESKEARRGVPVTISQKEARQRLQGFSTDAVLEEAESLFAAVQKAQEDLRESRERERELQRWHSFTLPLDALHQTKRVRVRTGTMAKRWADEFVGRIERDLEGAYVERISSDGQNVCLLLIDDRTEPVLEEWLRDYNFIEIILSGPAPQEQIAAEEERQAQANECLQQAQMRLSALADEAGLLLRLAYEKASETGVRVETEDASLRTEYLTFLQGYVPTEKESAFRTAVAQAIPDGVFDLQMEPAALEDEEVPILLENGPLVQPFESLVEMYSMPRYYEADPTPLLTPWYLLFFGLMIGDVGYGLLLLLATTLGLRFLPMKRSMKDKFRFFQLLSIPSMIAGLAFGSCLGGVVPIPGLIDPTENNMAMIGLSVAIGIVNIFFGLGIQGFSDIRRGRPLDAVYDVLFWYMALLGAMAFGGARMLGGSETVATIGLIVMIVGMLGIVLFSARENKGPTRFTWGLYNLYGITSYVGDIVSYTRIAALMLAGAFIGYAVNLISGMLAGAGILGILFAVVVFVVFHLFNLFLSGLSGYVHSMRLIYVEFFGKFYEGGGVPFKKLRSESTYIEIE